MSDFATALEYVHGALRGLQASGAKPTAARVVLDLLAKQGQPAAARAPQPSVAPEPAARQTQAPAVAAAIKPVVGGKTAATPRPRAAVPVLPKRVPAPGAVPITSGSKATRLAELRAQTLLNPAAAPFLNAPMLLISGCGNPEAELLFVGDAPGEDDPPEGDPLSTPATAMLLKIIQVMGFEADDVYLVNVLKARSDPIRRVGRRPPPTPSEQQACLVYVQQQIEIIRPRVVVALGGTAAEGLLGTAEPIGKLRSQWRDFRGIPLMPTYHPAYLLRNQSNAEKRKLWEDMLLVLAHVGRTPTPKQLGFFLAK